MSPRPEEKKKSTRPLPRKKKPSRAVVAQPPLTGKQKMHLRGLGHHLDVLVQVGADGVTEGVLHALNEALLDHELVKVRIAAEREARAAAVEQLAHESKAQVAQTLGRTALFFRARAEDSKITLP